MPYHSDSTLLGAIQTQLLGNHLGDQVVSTHNFGSHGPKFWVAGG